METEEPSDAPLEVELNPGQFPRINQLARISFFTAISVTLGGVSILYAADYDNLTVLLLFSLVVISAFGAFCGHIARRQLRGQRPHQKGTAIAVIGIIVCYVCIGWGVFVFWVLSHGTV